MTGLAQYDVPIAPGVYDVAYLCWDERCHELGLPAYMRLYEAIRLE